MYHTTSYTIHLLPCTPYKLFINDFPCYASYHFTSPLFFSYFSPYTSHHLPFQLISVLYITPPPLFSYFTPYTSRHLPFSAISRLTHHVTSLFQLFPALHITSPAFFSYFPSYTSHHLPFVAISHRSYHITSIFQLFPILHITSPHFFSYFPPYTSRHLLFQSRPTLYTRKPPSPVISHPIRHYVRPFFSNFPFYTTRLSVQITYDIILTVFVIPQTPFNPHSMLKKTSSLFNHSTVKVLKE
jgi:hypothetical protein